MSEESAEAKKLETVDGVYTDVDELPDTENIIEEPSEEEVELETLEDLSSEEGL